MTRPDFATNFRTPSSERITSRERKYASTAHPLDGRQTSRLSQRSPTARRNEAYIESPSIRKSETPSVYHSRFRSAHLPSSTNAFNSPILNPRHRSLDQEPSPTQPKPTDGTESTISTTAPSTVWDELDDLKLRIRKLEGTGKIPPSSNGSMERPRTAATSATTMSSSPKINGMKSVSPTANEFDEGTPHLLLNSALSKAKAMTSPEVYRTLEATTTDALNLAKMTFPNKNSTALERQLKRKADNMCRSLTELCIALSASNLVPSERPPIRARSSSRDAIASRHFPTQQISSRETEEERRYERAQSWDPEPTNTQRVLSRLEARRTSMKIDASNIGNVQASPPTELHLELKTPTQSTVTRANTVLQRRRLRDSINADDHDTTIRPLSRAAIDLTRANTTTAVDRDRKRLSRDYTSAHPMPSPFLRQFPGLSNIPGTRRSYLTNSPATNINTNNSMLNHVAQPSKERDLPPTPSTPGSSARRYLNRSTHAGGGDDAISSRITESRQRLVSSGQYTPARSLLSTRAGDRRSFVNANPADDQEHAGQF